MANKYGLGLVRQVDLESVFISICGKRKRYIKIEALPKSFLRSPKKTQKEQSFFIEIHGDDQQKTNRLESPFLFFSLIFHRKYHNLSLSLCFLSFGPTCESQSLVIFPLKTIIHVIFW